MNNVEGKTVLIVDDDLAFADMLSEILRDEGLEVLVEHDGVAGYERALRDKPDLMMFDMMMPRMSGVQALERIREDVWGKDVPAILLTNMNEPEALGAQPRQGPTECLLKTDLTLDQIAEKIKQVLQAA